MKNSPALPPAGAPTGASPSRSPSSSPLVGALRSLVPAALRPRGLAGRVLLGAALLLSLMGHGDGCCAGESSIFGPPTQATCPPTGTTLTYQNFAKPFVEKYCTQCHHSDLRGADRQGAPTFHDFDTLSGIKSVSDHIDQTTAAGPASVNEGMPNVGLKPTLDERYKLGEWIACDLPE